MQSESFVELLDAALSGDYTRVRRVASTVAKAVEPTDRDLARTIRAIVRRKGTPVGASGALEHVPVDAKSRTSLVEEAAWPSHTIFIEDQIESYVRSFVSDVEKADQFRELGVAVRPCLLLSGAPGTGKSLLAGQIAQLLNLPLFVVRLDSVMSSLLGDTAKNIRQVFDFVRNRDCVLFLDEMDAIAKIRDDKQELGELKRVVNTVLQALDSLDEKSITIAATNHAQLLDPAIWRRFPYKIELRAPSLRTRFEMWSHLLSTSDLSDDIISILAKSSSGLTGADIENLALAARRNAIAEGRALDTASLVYAANEIANGRQAWPARSGLGIGEKKRLAAELAASGRASQAELGRLFGISRQAVAGYLKENEDGA